MNILTEHRAYMKKCKIQWTGCSANKRLQQQGNRQQLAILNRKLPINRVFDLYTCVHLNRGTVVTLLFQTLFSDTMDQLQEKWWITSGIPKQQSVEGSQ